MIFELSAHEYEIIKKALKISAKRHDTLAAEAFNNFPEACIAFGNQKEEVEDVARMMANQVAMMPKGERK